MGTCGFGNGRTCSVCVSPASNQTNSQIRQTSTLIPLLLSSATSIIAFPQDGQGLALLPSLWIACSQSGIDRFRRESATQQLQTGRAAIAFFATPDDPITGTHFV